MTDYWLSKLFFDSQKPAVSARLREDRESVFRDYPLTDDTLASLRADDVASLAPHTNSYLLRFYFAATGMPDAEFIKRLRASIVS
jgi:hypothetical protein